MAVNLPVTTTLLEFNDVRYEGDDESGTGVSLHGVILWELKVMAESRVLGSGSRLEMGVCLPWRVLFCLG